MAGINGISAYQQTENAWNSAKTQSDKSQITSKTAPAAAAKDSKAAPIETKNWSPIDNKSSLVPRSSEYGSTIGDVQLSAKAKDYLGKLKSKFHNMEFITVSNDMKAQVQQNAASYGNANKMVVLIDEEKLERMATDESFRKKYEGIIAMSQAKMTQAKMGLSSSGANVKNFGMSELSAKQYASQFQAMGTSMGITGQQVQKAQQYLNTQKTMEGNVVGYNKASKSMADMSINLTKLTADLSSFYEKSQEDIARKLQSGVFGGQSKALRSLGVDLTQATLQEWALNHGMEANFKTMTQAEKTMLRYQYVMSSLSKSQGDFARTSGRMRAA